MSEPTRYPLAWPKHKARRKTQIRGSFGEGKDGGGTRPVTLATAVNRLEDQVARLGGNLSILSTNIELRMDGRPKGGQTPADPAICLYFQLKGEPVAMACDTFSEVAQNIAAVAAHIEATRRIERYGVATTAEMLQAFMALPPPSAENRPPKPWHEIFGVVPETATMETIDALYRVKMRATGGDEKAQMEINVARDQARDAIKAWNAT